MTPQRAVPASSLLLMAGLLCSSTAAAANGSVEVEADRKGLSILVDGADTGLKTPATVENLAPGRHEIRVRGECRVGALLVDVKDGATVPLSLATAEGRGMLTVEATPEAALVEVDGEAIKGSTVVSCGSHSVRVSHPGYLAAISTVTVDVDERRVLPMMLEELGTATLVLSVTPDSATIVLDGRALGTGNVADDTIAAGPHILEVQADGYKAVSKQLMLEAGDTRAFTFELEPVSDAMTAAPPPPPSTPPSSTSGRSGGMSPLKVTGITAAAVGVGLGAFGLTRFGQAATAYDRYVDRAENGPGPTSEVTAIRDDEVVPLRNVGLITTGLGTALLAGGVTMVVVF